MSRVADYDYALPEHAIAQVPAEPRDSSRLMVLSKDSGAVRHERFSDIGKYVMAGDVLVLNNTRVSAVRLMGQKKTGGQVEALLFEPLGGGAFRALVKPGRRLRAGATILFGDEVATVRSVFQSGDRELVFRDSTGLEDKLRRIGTVPLPPYIKQELADGERYQTVYSKATGSSAAPTAGLHFTPELIASLRAAGVIVVEVTLDVGIDTFRPMQGDDMAKQVMHGERYYISPETAAAIAGAAGRIIPVGTTSARTLETAAIGKRRVRSGAGCSSLFITPGHEFMIADGVLTNFHLPRTTMLCMVAAFCGRKRLLSTYKEALSAGYRFLSFGDSMLVIGERE